MLVRTIGFQIQFNSYEKIYIYIYIFFFCWKKVESLIHTEKLRDCKKSINMDINLEELSTDPSLRILISNYNPNILDQVR